MNPAARTSPSMQVHALTRMSYTLAFLMSSFKEVDRMKKRLSAKRKSELCLICGKCCMAMTFSGGEVDAEARDEIHWMELHGLKIDYVQEQGRTEYYFTIPKRC